MFIKRVSTLALMAIVILFALVSTFTGVGNYSVSAATWETIMQVKVSDLPVASDPELQTMTADVLHQGNVVVVFQKTRDKKAAQISKNPDKWVSLDALDPASNTFAPNPGPFGLTDPVAPGVLPTELDPEIIYAQPPEKCADANDPNQTCSTREGQPTYGDFNLCARCAIVMTGDAISIATRSGALLVGRPKVDSQHDLWVVVNDSDTSAGLHMSAPHGSFRGYFSLADSGANWTVDQIVHLRDLHLEHFLLPVQPKAFPITPVPNCGRSAGCDWVNVRVVVWDGNTLYSPNVGYYTEFASQNWYSDPAAAPAATLEPTDEAASS